MDPFERLDSWKEIASYLGRDIRTVQRWEREQGLPVRRLQHKRQATVYALKPEIDAWLLVRQPVDLSRKGRSKRYLVAPFLLVAAAGLLAFWNLTPDAKTRLGVPLQNLSLTVEPEAYESYLRGLHAFSEFTGEAWLEMRHRFERAVALDPDFAEARAWLALSHASVAYGGLTATPEKEWERARTEAEESIRSNPDLAEPYVVQSLISLFHDWNWGRAQEWNERAIEVNPRSTWAHWARGWLLTSLGRHTEAIDAMRTARELDPMNAYMSTSLGEMFWFAGRFDEAETEWSNAAARHPSYPRPYLLLVLMYQGRGSYSSAIDAAEKLYRLSGRSPEPAASLGRAYALSGPRGYWEWKLRYLRDRGAPCNIHFVNVHARLGLTSRALQCLERMHEQRVGPIALVRVHPVLEWIRSEPRLAEWVRRLDLPEPSAESADR